MDSINNKPIYTQFNAKRLTASANKNPFTAPKIASDNETIKKMLNIIKSAGFSSV